VTLIPGDGIGQETARAVKALFKYENVPIDFEEVDVHGIGDEPGARELFNQSIESLKRNRVGLKGTSPLNHLTSGILYTPLERSGHQSWNVALRQGLDIYASVILIKNIPGFKTRHANVDFAIIRVYPFTPLLIIGKH
jgi:isocitrate dehydrogenase (NAD+)